LQSDYINGIGICSNEYEGCWHIEMPPIEWLANKEVPWNTAAVLATVQFAAERIEDMLPPDDPLRDKMRTGLRRMNNGEMRSNGMLVYMIEAIYVTSVEIHLRTLHWWGTENMAAWIPKFQEYQGMILCAHLQMKKDGR